MRKYDNNLRVNEWYERHQIRFPKFDLVSVHDYNDVIYKRSLLFLFLLLV